MALTAWFHTRESQNQGKTHRWGQCQNRGDLQEQKVATDQKSHTGTFGDRGAGGGAYAEQDGGHNRGSHMSPCALHRQIWDPSACEWHLSGVPRGSRTCASEGGGRCTWSCSSHAGVVCIKLPSVRRRGRLGGSLGSEVQHPAELPALSFGLGYPSLRAEEAMASSQHGSLMPPAGGKDGVAQWFQETAQQITYHPVLRFRCCLFPEGSCVRSVVLSEEAEPSGEVPRRDCGTPGSAAFADAISSLPTCSTIDFCHEALGRPS